MPPPTKETLLRRERSRMNVRQRKLEVNLRKENEKWEARLRRAAKKLEKDMNKTNEDVIMIDELERTNYLSNSLETVIDGFDEMQFVDKVTKVMTTLPTYFQCPSLLQMDGTYEPAFEQIVLSPPTMMAPMNQFIAPLRDASRCCNLHPGCPLTGYGAGFDDDDPPNNLITATSDPTMVVYNSFRVKVFAFQQPVQASRNVTYEMFKLQLRPTYSPLKLAVLNNVSRLLKATYGATTLSILNNMVIAVRTSTFNYGATRLSVLNVMVISVTTYGDEKVGILNNIEGQRKFTYSPTFLYVLKDVSLLMVEANNTNIYRLLSPTYRRVKQTYAPCIEIAKETNDISTAIFSKHARVQTTHHSNSSSFSQIDLSIMIQKNESSSGSQNWKTDAITARVRNDSH